MFILLLIFKLVFCFNYFLYKDDYNKIKNKKTTIVKNSDSFKNFKKYDTLLVKDNIVLEEVLVNNPVQIMGINKPIISGNYYKNIIIINSNNVVLNNISIENSGKSCVTDYSGILIENSFYCKIKNNLFRNNSYSIYIANSKYCEVVNNIILSTISDNITSGNGIHLWKTENIFISNNLIKNHRDGIYIEFSSNMLIKNNISLNNIRYGLHFMFSNFGVYCNNYFLNNQTGVAVMFSNNIKMLLNNFIKSWGNSSYGLLLKDINDSFIIGNNFFSNTKAVFVDGCNRNKFFLNFFKYNAWSLDIWGNSENNIFFDNVFFYNYFDISTNSKNLNNFFNKNYWSKSPLIDLDRDHICDIFYRPVEVFGIWVAKYHELSILLNSLVLSFLEYTEKLFPFFIPLNLIDFFPLLN